MNMATILQPVRLSFVHSPAASSPSILSFAGRQISPILYKCQQQARHAHSKRNVSYTAAGDGETDRSAYFRASKMPKTTSPLSILPLPNLIRSYLITAVSSSPLLLRASLGALKFLAHSRSPILNPDRNPILHFLLKRTVYAQFCAGETADEVDQTINKLKRMGYKGVLLSYAREVCLHEDQAQIMKCTVSQKDLDASAMSSWARGTLCTVKLAQPGDFVAIKFTGAGTQALQHLADAKPPPPQLEKSITEICDLAMTRNVRLLFDAEQDAVQAGIDAWTISYMKQYNRKGKAIVYGTYQAYKKSAPGTLADHLALAQKNDFVLGIKLVRGAYLGSDPRCLFWDTIDDTHKAYDGIAESLMRHTYSDILKPVSPDATTFPSISVVLATHNKDSIAKAQKIRNAQVCANEALVDLAYGQLMGMAENISCGLVVAAQLAKDDGRESMIDIPKAYQYLVWGTVGECSQYLVRRAEENKDALSRTKEGRKALGTELLRRLGISAA